MHVNYVKHEKYILQENIYILIKTKTMRTVCVKCEFYHLWEVGIYIHVCRAVTSLPISSINKYLYCNII